MIIDKKHISWAALLVLIGAVIMLGSCGDNKAAPDGATIMFIEQGISLKGLTADTPVNLDLVLRAADGTPLPNTDVKITGTYAVPSPAGSYQFYYYPGATTVSNTAVDSGFTAQTDKNGVYSFSILVYQFASGGTTTNTFTDTIQAISGTAAGSISLSVQ